jgi:glycosyltransferase involved in cell wall biosynthesis
MSNELVSVVIPTYNRAYCVGRAIDSVLAQTHRNVDVLVIDDGSTDDTARQIHARYGHELRVRYFWQANRGVSEARNTGLRNVRGEFVALLDSDDIWHPWKLEAQLAAFRNLPEVGMIWTDMEAIDPEGNVFDPRHLKTMYDAYQRFSEDDLFTSRYPLSNFAPQLGRLARDATVFVGDIFSQMIAGSLVHTSTVLLRRERLNKVGFFNPELRYLGEDFDFHLRTCREGPVALIDVSSIQYQRGLGDHLTRPEHRVHLALHFLKVILPYIQNDRDRIHLSDETIDSILSETHQWIGEAALNAGKMDLAREHLWECLRKNWFQPHNAGLFLMSCLPSGVESAVRRGYRFCKSHLNGNSQVAQSV